MITDTYYERARNLSVGDILVRNDDVYVGEVLVQYYNAYAGVVLSLFYQTNGVLVEVLCKGKTRLETYSYGEWIGIASEIDGECL